MFNADQHRRLAVRSQRGPRNQIGQTAPMDQRTQQEGVFRFLNFKFSKKFRIFQNFLNFPKNFQFSKFFKIFQILVQRRLCRERNLKFGPKSAPEVTYFGNKFLIWRGEAETN